MKGFARWASKEGISDSVLRDAVEEMEKGLIEAQLGGGVCKKRIPVLSRGKRGGARASCLFSLDEKQIAQLIREKELFEVE